MSKKKYVSISAILRCSQVSATTTFVKKTNILKINDIEIATENNIEIKPFSEDCQKGGCLSFGAGGKPCTPKLKKWKSEATKRKISGEHPLLENSTTECETIPGSKVVIQDPKQNTVFYDFEALMILDALDKLNEMLAFRLNQYKNDPDKFNACFDKYFGEGHSPEDKKSIVDRMRSAQNLLSRYKNSDGTLNEDRFIYDDRFFTHGEPHKTKEDYKNTLAYVYRTNINGGENINGNVYNSDHTIHINPNYLENGYYNSSGFETLAGTLAHEMAHFNDIGHVDGVLRDGTHITGGTKDIAYRHGDESAMDLVDKYPEETLINTDNYMLFLESGENCANYP